MAIARGAGTEIIRCQHFEDLAGGSDRDIIIGEQHHIYTVLSIIVYCNTQNASSDYVDMGIRGYDSYAGTTAQFNRIFRQVISETATFVWNDKFSFNGCEPADFSGAMNSVDDQNAIADQDPSNGSPVSQKLQLTPNSASSNYDVTVTFIDQNNA
tara:strand:+ start:1315 stop:1779 length:465 start_codon:yes stop_codon:yes gene_type:complete